MFIPSYIFRNFPYLDISFSYPIHIHGVGIGSRIDKRNKDHVLRGWKRGVAILF